MQSKNLFRLIVTTVFLLVASFEISVFAVDNPYSNLIDLEAQVELEEINELENDLSKKSFFHLDFGLTSHDSNGTSFQGKAHSLPSQFTKCFLPVSKLFLKYCSLKIDYK